MSSAPHAALDRGPIPARAALLLATIVLVAFALAIAWSDHILHDETRAAAPGGEAAAPLVGREEIGIVDMEQFALESRAAVLRRQKQHHLQSYGWIDRDAGLIHIPVSSAMDDVVRELSEGRNRR